MQFQILGPLRVTDEDEQEVALGGAKPAAVLAMLLLRPNEVVSADRLIEDLWEGDLPPTAAKTLQVHMSRLRRALGDSNGTIQTARGGYVLELDPQKIDARRFESLVAEGSAALSEGAHSKASARLRSALGLWRGEALADFAYASFAQDEIARLDGLRSVAREQAVEAELALGRHAELVPELKWLVKRHPLSEHVRAQLMLALYRSGRQAEALGVYRAARRALVDQLGIEPGEELRALERAILAQDDELAAPSAQPRRRRPERAQRGTLVGYERELAGLEDLLEQALSGRGHLALVAGEPGIGKSRLVDELAAVAGARGAQVVWGRARSGGGAPAYWPWIQVLRALIADRDAQELRTQIGSGAPDLVQLLPALRDVFGDVDTSDASDADDARFRMFDAAARFLGRAAAGHPVVVVLDDLHVADRATLQLLEFVAPAVLDARVLIIGTYRDTQADLERPLRDSLGELARTTDCLQLVLTGLDEDDTAHFVELSAGIAPMPKLAAAIHEASSGNPLFVSELVRLLRAENRLHELEDEAALVLPRGVEQVITRRIDRLSEVCRQTLATASVIGREFDLTLLERAGDASGDELLGHVEDAIASRVVELAAGGSFRFSHDVVRQTLYSGLGAADRRRRHEAVANALERLHAARPDPVLADLAHHFTEALPGADPAKAIHYLTGAADAAAELGARHDAAALYERAAELARVHGADEGLQYELYLRLAEQFIVIPDMAPATAAIESAEALSLVAPDRERDARLTIARAHLRMLDALAVPEDELFEVIEMFREADDPAGEARAWGAFVTLNCGRSNRLKGGEAAESMLACARRAGSKALENLAMRNIGSNFALGYGPVPDATRRVQALIAGCRDDYTKSRLLNSVATLATLRGHFDEAREHLAEARRVCPPRELPNVDGYLAGTAARIETLCHNYRRAEEFGRAGIAVLEEQGLVRYLSSEACFLVDALIPQGKLEEAEALLDRARPWAAEDDADALLRQARSRARLEFARGNADAAEALAREALRYVEDAAAPDEHADTLILLAEILSASGAEDEARSALEQAIAVAGERGATVLVNRAQELLGRTDEFARAVAS